MMGDHNLVITNCFEDLFQPSSTRTEPNAFELEEAAATGMPSANLTLARIRVHRALVVCMQLQETSQFYKNLFPKITAALENALAMQGSLPDKKVAFLQETTTEFSVRHIGDATEYYFEGLHLPHALFHADLLLTKHVQVCIPYMLAMSE